jgi:hypothetical protein
MCIAIRVSRNNSSSQMSPLCSTFLISADQRYASGPTAVALLRLEVPGHEIIDAGSFMVL